MPIFQLRALPTLIGLALAIILLVIIFLWLGIVINKHRTIIGRQFKSSGDSNRQQRRMEQAIVRRRRNQK